jgi:hypothetical protein
MPVFDYASIIKAGQSLVPDMHEEQQKRLQN